MNTALCPLGRLGRPVLVFLLLALAGTARAASSNLLYNASFDNKDNALDGWQIKYDHPGESWYAENYQNVHVLPQEGGHKTVLHLAVPRQDIADNQGTKTDSFPIPIKPGGKYRFTAYARSTGPNCRVMVEGYKWRPDATPHPNPTIYELRRCFRFHQVYFGQVQGGDFGGVGPEWKRATMILENQAKGSEKDKEQKHFDEIQFLVVHLVAIGGVKGDLYLDDISLERLN